jgi:cytochrome c oxidase subunit 2
MRTKLAIIVALTCGLFGARVMAQPAGAAAPNPTAGSAAKPPTAAPAAGSATAPAPVAAAGSGSATAPVAAAGSGSATAPAAAAGSGSATAPAAAAGSGSATAPADAAGSGSATAPAAGSGSATAPAAGSGSATAPAATAAAAAPAPAAAPAGKGPLKWFEQLAKKPWDTDGTYWMPKSVNAAADGVDEMFYAVLGLSIFCFLGVAGVTIYFVIRYRARPGHKAEPSTAHSDAMEITWTVIPTIIVVFLFVFGWRDYVHMMTPPQKAIEIQVTAQKWQWTFTHSNGVSDDVLFVPVNTPVRLIMTSKDVIHSFFVPVLRVKQDVVPQRYTSVWFQATKPGTYRLYCAEYCGGEGEGLKSGHSQMKTVVVVLPSGDYERYLNDSADTSKIPPAELGAKLYEKKGCNGCHSIDGSPKAGPSWKGDFGTQAELLDGSTITVDENYVRESILRPQAKARKAFEANKGMMPPFEGQLKEHEIAGLIAYIKSLK